MVEAISYSKRLRFGRAPMRPLSGDSLGTVTTCLIGVSVFRSHTKHHHTNTESCGSDQPGSATAASTQIHFPRKKIV